jgi:hypothetical protein
MENVKSGEISYKMLLVSEVSQKSSDVTECMAKRTNNRPTTLNKPSTTTKSAR